MTHSSWSRLRSVSLASRSAAACAAIVRVVSSCSCLSASSCPDFSATPIAIALTCSLSFADSTKIDAPSAAPEATASLRAAGIARV